MAKKIIWTPEAEKTFNAVIDYLQQHWSEREIKNFIERVKSVAEHIQRHPLSYRSAGKEDVREALITEHNLLLYREPEILFIFYIFGTHAKIRKENPNEYHR